MSSSPPPPNSRSATSRNVSSVASSSWMSLMYSIVLTRASRGPPLPCTRDPPDRAGHHGRRCPSRPECRCLRRSRTPALNSFDGVVAGDLVRPRRARPRMVLRAAPVPRPTTLGVHRLQLHHVHRQMLRVDPDRVSDVVHSSVPSSPPAGRCGNPLSRSSPPRSEHHERGSAVVCCASTSRMRLNSSASMRASNGTP